jgi:SAM-dependent methyltransferase
MAEDWTLDELAHAGAEHLDPAFVAGYDRKQGEPDPAEDVAVLTARGLGRDATVVDLGAGTGQFALAAARVFGRVVAVDVSEVMLERLRTRAAGLATLECVRAGFIGYAHEGAPADAVHTRNALHHLPDFWKAMALTRIAALLRPGGVLRLHDLVYDFGPADAPEALERWFAGAVDDPAAGYTRADLAEHVRTEHSTYRWLLEPILERAGFAVEDASYGASVYAAYTCVRR